MDYKSKVQYAEQVAKDLQGVKSLVQIKSELKSKGLYDRDISNVIASAGNILRDNYTSEIRKHLVADIPIEESTAFGNIDRIFLNTLVEEEKQVLGLVEKKKLTKLIKDGVGPEQALEQIDNRFLSYGRAMQQINNLREVQHQNSGGNRLLNIIGGIVLIIITGIIAIAAGRLFYFLPIIGLVMIVKGFMTEKMLYDE